MIDSNKKGAITVFCFLYLAFYSIILQIPIGNIIDRCYNKLLFTHMLQGEITHEKN